MAEEKKIDTWKKFSKHIRSRNTDLLKGLSYYPEAILVGGCQRSGTTMISNAIMQGEGIEKLSELDSALVLAEVVGPNLNGNYCFQTTYINERFYEYWKYGKKNKLVWMVRNPYSVVYSLTRFSERFCLDELFLGCGKHVMNKSDQVKFDRFGSFAINRIRRACYSYNAKVNQLVSILQNLDEERVIVVDYDELVKDKCVILASIYKFFGIHYKPEFSELINEKSIGKASNLSKDTRFLIDSLSGPYYDLAKKLVCKI
ncbi:sulfotransferase [Methylomonas sp. MO1]|uniref:sulfotransferase domain-containing protein n=1 Tax=Methylomonas sp. MO1 TaxID=3073619 RepID=UPI0028A4BA7D|nr:sulfotransferase domain-containing protein [Methylomonas sp. MO1]MDT4291640.1 sulfotransferase [Methylomonas sp. MO1]